MQAFQNNEGVVSSIERRKKRPEALLEAPSVKSEPVPQVPTEIPRTCSFIRLYRSYLEFSAALALSLVATFLFIKLGSTWLVDVSLLPWVVWVLKKLLDGYYSYKLRASEIEAKYLDRLMGLESKEAAAVYQGMNPEASFHSNQGFMRENRNHEVSII